MARPCPTPAGKDLTTPQATRACEKSQNVGARCYSNANKGGGIYGDAENRSERQREAWGAAKASGGDAWEAFDDAGRR